MILQKNFSEKDSEKIGVFGSKQSLSMQNFDHNLVFGEKRLFRLKLAKIICNIEPRSQSYDRELQRQRCKKLQCN
jgi:hypothetical protein